MRFWYLIVAQVKSLVLRDRRQDELDEELRLHLEQDIEQRVARGMSPRAARQDALRVFGGVEKTKDECRDAWGLRLVDELARDTRYATRRLTRDWRFSLLAMLILALGIGVNTAMFSVVNAMFSPPVPFRDAHRLVNIYQNDRSSGQPWTSSYPAFQDMAGHTDVYAGATAFTLPVPVRFYQDEIVRSGLAEFATSTHLRVLGLDTSAGRWFTVEEDRLGAAPVAVLSHRTWTSKFGTAPSVIGETIRINGVPVTVVGVGPEGFSSSLHNGIVMDFWLSIPSLVLVGGGGRAEELERTAPDPLFLVTARLRDGVDLPQARAAMTGLGARLAREFPDHDSGRGISVLRSDTVRIHPQFDGALSYGASSLMVLVGLLLAIACTNLATWLLVRGLSRGKEISVRLALGATRGQIVRHLLVESTLLAGAGGAVGCLLAVWAIRLVAQIDLPLDAGVGLDYRVLVFTLVLSLVTGVAFGLAPALKATRVTLTPALRGEGDITSSGRRAFTLKNVLVVSQVALSCVLLVWGGIVLQRLARGRAADLGFTTEGLAFVETDARFAGYTADEAAALQETLLDRIAALPGIESATRAVGPPVGLARNSSGLVIDESAPAGGEVTRVGWAWAGPGYFETLQVPLLYGRSFTQFDRPETPDVAVINEGMARRYFGRLNAVGGRFRVAEAPDAAEGAEAAAGFEVIGVVPDIRTSVFEEPRPLFYRSSRQAAVSTSTVLIRTALDPESLLQQMQQTVRDLDSQVPVLSVRTMTQYVDDELGGDRQVGAALGGLGALGLGLASLGLYAVMAFAVSRRTREIGIRRALGAQWTQVIWTVSRGVATLLGVGVTTGLALSWLSVQGAAAMTSSLSQGGGVTLRAPTVDLTTFMLVTMVMAAVGLAAAFFPARRAARANPLVALREL